MDFEGVARVQAAHSRTLPVSECGTVEDGVVVGALCRERARSRWGLYLESRRDEGFPGAGCPRDRLPAPSKLRSKGGQV
jgi:hypothetical protein